MWERVHELARDYVNFLHPVRKLREKVRSGVRITRRYDIAQTPYRRLLAGGVLPRRNQARLAALSNAVDPLRFKLAIEVAQRTLAQRAVPLLSFSRSGRNLYKAATQALVGSSREASRLTINLGAEGGSRILASHVVAGHRF